MLKFLGASVLTAFLSLFGWHFSSTPASTTSQAENSAMIASTGPSSLVRTESISSCGQINKSGNYILNQDITSTSTSLLNACINIHDSYNVNLSCAGHTINAVTPLYVTNTNNFSISSCTFKGPRPGGPFRVKIASSTYGEIKGNTMDDQISVSDSSFLNVHDNVFSAPWVQIYTTNSDITNNNFSLDTSEYSTAQSLIESDRGSNNQFTKNIINGGSDAVYSTELGSDDGIFFTDENKDLITGNSIKNTYDCGIETFGLISNTVMDSNTITKTGYCGIGAWYYNSWLSNTVSNNIIDFSNRMFAFMRYGGLRPAGFDPGDTYHGHSLPADQYVYFKDNQFINNKSTNNSDLIPSNFDMHLTMLGAKGTSYGETYPQDSQFILQNNVLKNNDFSTTTPLFPQPTMIVDGTGNICTSSLDTAYPIKCNGQTSTSTNSNKPSASIDQASLIISSTATTAVITGTAANTNSISVNISASAPAKVAGMNWFGNESIPVVNGRWSLSISPEMLGEMSNFSPLTLQIGVVNMNGVVNTLTTGALQINLKG